QAEPLGIRFGIHVGQFLVGQGSGASQIDLDGKLQAWAALDDLAREAEPGAIVVSDTAAAFLERDFALTAIPAEPGRAPRFRLAGGEWSALGLRRRMAAFVGRGHELELLQSRLAAALSGHGQVVGILGEAGIGKSRLIFEFRRALLDLRVSYFEGRCHSYTSAVPYHPVLDILRQNFHIADPDSPETTAGKIRLGLQELEIDPEGSGPYLFNLLGVKEGAERVASLSPGAIKARTFEALRLMGLNGARRRPVVFVVEDLQWIDATSEECLASLMESMVAAPALLLATYRPRYRPPWVDKSYVTQVALQPLPREHVLCVLLSIRDTDQLPDPLARAILDRAEGNPFFIEELSRAVEETGDSHRPLGVPDTIQEVLLARIDRLPMEPKRLLQTA